MRVSEAPPVHMNPVRTPSVSQGIPTPPPLPTNLLPTGGPSSAVGNRSARYRTPLGSFTAVVDASEATQVDQLHLVDCDTAHSVLNFSYKAQLQSVYVKNCPHIKANLNFSDSAQVQKIFFDNCPELRGKITLPASAQLREISFIGCPLVNEIPDVSHSPAVQKINFENTPVSHIPDSVFRLPPAAVVRLTLSQVSSDMLQKIYNYINHPNYAGPRFEWAYENITVQYGNRQIPAFPFSGDPQARQRTAQSAGEQALQRKFGFVNAAGPSGEAQGSGISLDSDFFKNHAMLEEVLRWRQRVHPLVDLNPVWQQLAQHKNAKYFATFLGKLQVTCNVPGRVGQVNRLLNKMESQPELALRCLEKTMAPDADCVDRSALILMGLECESVQFNAELNVARYAKNPRQLLQLGLGLHQMSLVSTLAQEKVQTLENQIICGMTRGLKLLPENKLDQVEVHMGYFSTLASEFKWPMKMSPMAYPKFANLTGMPALRRRERIIAHAHTLRQKMAQLGQCQSSSARAADRRDERGDIGQARQVLRRPENLLGGSAVTQFLCAWEPVNKLLEMQNPDMVHQFKIEKKAQETKIRDALEKLDPHEEGYQRKCDALRCAFDEVGPALAEKYKVPVISAWLNQGRRA
jgi:hypothetical protein